MPELSKSQTQAGSAGSLRSKPICSQVGFVRANYDPDLLFGDTFDLDDLFDSKNTGWTLPGLETYDVFAASGRVTLVDYSDLVYGQMLAAKRRAGLI